MLWAAPVCRGHGSFHERLEALAAALREKPNDPGLLYRLAAEYHEHGDWETALRQLAHLDAIAPGVVFTDLLRGRALAAGGRYSEAKLKLDAYLAAQPGHAVALTVRARVLSELGELRQAADDCAAAVAATPRPEPDAYYELAAFLLAAGRGEDAVRALDEGIARLGALPALIERAIALELTLGRGDAAVARCDAQIAAAVPPIRPPLMAMRARVLARAGRTTEARAAWQALREHLASLPPPDRSSHAMLRLAEEANSSLVALDPP